MADSPYKLEGLPDIRAGAAQVEITPPVGTSLAGYFHDRVSEGVRDPLRAHALILESAGEKMALVSCDLICLSRDTVEPAKRIIEQQTGIPPSNVLICATHTHTGPDTRAGRLIPTNEAWLAELPGMIAASVEAAAADTFDAILLPGRHSETRLGSNRLGRKKDGSEVFGKEDVIGPAGPIDPELVGMSVRDHEGEVHAVISNYAMHADTMGGNFISAGWPGEMAKALAQVYGDDCISVFLNGTCGDINHHHWTPIRHVGKGPHKSTQMGRIMAGLTINCTEAAEPMETAEISALLRVVEIPYYTRDEQMRAEVEALRASGQQDTKDQFIVERFDEWPHDGEMAPVTVQALRIGEALFVGLPGEVFVEWGLEIKHWSPRQFTFVAELANDWFGYIPTSDQAERGAYGAKPILSRRLCADGGRQMTDAVQVMMWENGGDASNDSNNSSES
jgi:hypothetical protein